MSKKEKQQQEPELRAVPDGGQQRLAACEDGDRTG